MASKRDYLLSTGKVEVTYITSKTLFLPVRFKLADEIQEATPAIVAREIEEEKVMRFYMSPSIGQTLHHNGLKWLVTDIVHMIQVKGSRNQDECPVVIAELVGES